MSQKKILLFCFSVLLFCITYFVKCTDETSNTLDTSKHGKVVAIADGDSFTILTDSNTQVKIRLHGVDCPEKKQAYGQKCKQFTSDLIFGHKVTIIEQDKDRYGRIVAIVLNEDSINVNEELLKNGFAWHYKQYSKSEDYALMEEKAREGRVGLWADKNPTPPWEFRRLNTNSKKSIKQ